MTVGVVTGCGVVSAVGVGCDAHWDAIAAGRDGIRRISRFATDEFPSSLAALVEGVEPGTARFGIVAAREAIAQAALPSTLVSSSRTALVVGCAPTLEIGHAHDIAAEIRAALGIGGPALCVSTACTSSTIAFGVALRLLRDGEFDVVIAGGTDVLTPETFAGFNRLGVVSTEKCEPFGERPGMTPGEGAAFVVLERPQGLRARGAKALGELRGFGASADSHHETAPAPTGRGVASAIVAALADAQVVATDVGYVNAHGTGTEQNDDAEVRGVKLALGEHVEHIPISSSKSIFGHALAAAGAIEVVTTIVAMEHGVVPPTLRLSKPRLGAPRDPVASAVPRAHGYRYAVSTNSAFGGSNAAVVLALPAENPDDTRETRTHRREVVVTGVGVVAPFGVVSGVGDSSSAAEHLGGMRPPSMSGRVQPFEMSDYLRSVDPRGFDPAARFLTTAAQLALIDAGVKIRGVQQDSIGLVVAAACVSAESDVEFRRSIEKTLRDLSARAFARNVLNASAGSASLALGLRGGGITLSQGSGGGLLAVVLAAMELAQRAGNDRIIAGGVDEAAPADVGEGAACVLLEASLSPSLELPLASPLELPLAKRRGVRVAGWALGAAADVDAAIEVALDRAGMRRTDIGLVGVDGGATTSGSALAVAWAVHGLRAGRASAALVTSAPGDEVACACIFTSEAAR